MRHGFSLVELSIVLVIFGLLAGGILSGQSLIRAAELRSVTTDYGRYTAAVKIFRDKYFAIPGDMPNATAFWGSASATGCSNRSGTATTSPGTCDGNGDGVINFEATAVSSTEEMYQFWRQLALAGLVEGTYTGISGTVTKHEGVIGKNVPRSRISNAGWGAVSMDTLASGTTGDPYLFNSTYGNAFSFGSYNQTWVPNGATLKPDEAWNIDTKMDDGKPGTGSMIAVPWGTAGAGGAAAAAGQGCTDASASSATGANYMLTTSAQTCAFYIRNAI